MCVRLVCFVYCVFWFGLPVLLIWFMLYVLMAPSVQCVHIWRVLFTVYFVLFWLCILYMLMVYAAQCVCVWCALSSVCCYRLPVLLFAYIFVYLDGFFCSVCVHLVCVVCCVRWFVLPVLLMCCILHILMASSVQIVCILCVWFIN